LAYNFNNHASPLSPGGETHGALGTSAPAESTATPAAVPVTSDNLESAAFVRFRSCRWQQPKEEGHDTEFCTHREVKPYAGTQGFDADAWCPDCQYYKLRRAPKKREPRDDYSY
jgi:hypothetical protein